MALALSTRLSALRRVRYCTAAPALYRLSTSSRLLESKTPPSQVELYRSPMATPVRILKTVSVTSASITVLFLPAVSAEGLVSHMGEEGKRGRGTG
jgi:hypothetical protein